MSRRQVVPQNALPPQPVLADANYTCSPLDTSVTIVSAGLTVTLPQNPSPGLTVIDFLAGFAFTLSGGAFSPLTPSDPVTVPVGTTGFAAFSSVGWEITGLGTGGSGVTSVTASSPLASSGGTTPNISISVPVPVPDGGTGVATLAAHGVLVGEGTGNVAVTGPGTVGQVLTSNGAAADPTFQAAASGTVTSVTGTAPIVSSGGVAPAISITKPVRAFGTNGAPVGLTASAQIVASATFTPVTSGKMTVHVTGVVDDTDSTSTSRSIVLTLSDGASATPAIATQATFKSTGASQTPAQGFAAVFPLDLLGTPVTFPVGTPAQLNAVLTGDASSSLTVPTGGVQIYVEEALG